MAGAILNPDSLKILIGNGTSDKIYDLSSKASSTLLTVTNLLQAAEVEKKVVSSINKKRVPSDVKQQIQNDSPTLDVQVGSKIFTTKCNSISIGGNNMATPLFMSGLKNPFGQIMGGRSCYASLSIVTNDPDTIIDVLSLFRSNSVYDTLNNMITQTRSLLKTKEPSTPNTYGFTQKVAAGETVYNSSINQQLRLLSKSIKRDQLLKVISDVFIGDTDLVYDQQEPMVIKHNLLNSFGYYTFVPTTVSLETMRDTKDSISINLNCQWVDTRFIMKEALKITNISKNHNENHILSWYNTLNTDILKKDTTSNKIGFEKKQEELAQNLEYYKGTVARQGTLFSVAPVLASYALYRYKKDVLDIGSRYNTIKQSTLDFYTNAARNGGTPDAQGFTNHLTNISIAQSSLDNEGNDIEDESTRLSDELRIGSTVGASLGTNYFLTKGFSKVFNLGVRTTLKKVGAAGLAGTVAELAFIAVDSGFTALNTTSINYKSLNSVKLDNKITYTTYKANTSNVKSNNFLYYINLPYLMSNYYLDFIDEILITYSNESLLEEKIRQWSGEALSLIGNERKALDENADEQLKKIINHTSPDNSNVKIFTYKDDAFIVNTSIANEIYGDIKEKNKENLFNERKKSFTDSMGDYAEGIKKTYQGKPVPPFAAAQSESIIKDLYSTIVSNFGVNSYSIIQTLDDIGVNTLKNYLRNLNQDQINEAVAATYSMVTFNNVHELANMIIGIDNFIDTYENIKNKIIVGGVYTNDQITSLNNIIKLLTETKNKLRINDLSENSKKVLAKRARTIIAYGNNYSDETTKVNDTLIFKSSILIIRAILQNAFNYSFVALENGKTIYNIYFSNPYKASEMGFFGIWFNTFVKKFDFVSILSGILIGTILSLLTGPSLIVVIVLSIIIFVVFVLGHVILNSLSENLLPDAVKARLQGAEVSISNVLNNVPKMYFGFYLINNITNTYDSDFFFLKNDSIYPPKTIGSFNGSLNNVEDPDTHLTIPLPYYRENKRLLHPGFWVWSEKTEETDQIIRESQTSVAIAETSVTQSNYSRDEIQNILTATGNTLIEEAVTINSTAAVNILLKQILKISLVANLIKVGSLYGSKFTSPSNTIFETYITPSATNLDSDKIKKQFILEVYNNAKILFDRVTPGVNLASSAFDMTVSIQETIEGKLYVSGAPAASLIADLSMSFEDLKTLPIDPSLSTFDISKFFNSYPNLKNNLDRVVSNLTYRNGVPKVKNSNDNSEISYTTAKTEIDRYSKLALNLYTTAPDTHFKDKIINSTLDGRIIKNLPEDLLVNIATLKESVAQEDSGSSFSHIIGKTKNLKQKILGAVEVKRKKTLREIRELSAFIQNTGAVFGEVGLNQYKQRIAEVINKSKLKKFTEKGAKTNPTFKVYFIQDNARDWLLMDDFYSYSGIESIETYDDATSPVQVCKLVVSNFTNALSSLMGDRLNKENPLMSNTAYDAQVSAIFLKPGCKVKVFLGYGTRLREEDCVFTGEIVSMQGEQIREIICQSHGTLLTEYISVEIPEVIEVSLYDLPERRNIYSIHDLIITKMLQTHLVEKVPRFDGRLGDINTLSGPSAIDSDFTRIQVSTVKENLAQWGTEVLYKTIVKTLDIKIPDNLNSAISSLIKNSDKKFYNIGENIRIFNAPINDTRYINLLKKDSLSESLSKNITDLNSQLFKPVDTLGNKGWFSFRRETTRSETLSYRIGEIVSSIKEIFGGEKWAKLQTITHNETYWDYMQEIALQLPNHAVAIRSFEERNTLVITDTTRGYYRTGRRGSPDEKLSQYLINRLEPIKGNTIEGCKIVIDNLFLPTEDSMALFILFYTYMTRILATLESDSQTRTFYETPNESQINAVVNLLELLMDEDGVDRINGNRASIITTAGDEFKGKVMFELLEPIYGNGGIYTDIEKTILIVTINNILKSKKSTYQWFGPSSVLTILQLTDILGLKNILQEPNAPIAFKEWAWLYDIAYKDIKESINALGLNKLGVSKNSVEARVLAIALLFQNERGAKEIGNKKESPKEVAGLLKYIVGNHVAAETSIDLISPEELDKDLGSSYEFFSKGEAIRLTCSQIIDWALQCAYSRSSVHRKFSENHYKSTKKDIISNEINLQKGFNAVEVSILTSPKKYKDLDNIDTGEKNDGEIVKKIEAQVNSNAQDKNLYKTFIKNGYQPDLVAGEDKVGASMSVNVLCNLVRDYYGGQIIFLGDSDIKSWDIITLYDEMSDMFGTIQVKSVAQTYVKSLGWITTVTPWLPTVNQYGSSEGPDIPAMQYGMRFLQAGSVLATIGLGILAFRYGGGGMNILKRGNYYARKLASKVPNIANKFATTQFLNKLNAIPKALTFVNKALRKNNFIKLNEDIVKNYGVLKNSLSGLKLKIGDKFTASLKNSEKIKELELSLKNFPKEGLNDNQILILNKYAEKIQNSINKINVNLSNKGTTDYTKLIESKFTQFYEKIDKKLIQKIEKEIQSISPNDLNKAKIESIYKNNNIDVESLIKSIDDDIAKLETSNADNIAAALKKYNTKLDEFIVDIGKESDLTPETQKQIATILENSKNAEVLDFKADIETIRTSLQDAYNKQFLSNFDNIAADLAPMNASQKASYITNLIKDFHKIGSENLSVFGALGTAVTVGGGVAFGTHILAKEALDYFLFDPAQSTMSGLISIYYTQNAVAISGLWCKGEPFVANLDGMTKASFSRGKDPIKIYTGRLQKGYDEALSEISDTFIETNNTLQRAGESTSFQNRLLASEVINASENSNGNTTLNEIKRSK